jgi:hypothetical protein
MKDDLEHQYDPKLSESENTSRALCAISSALAHIIRSAENEFLLEQLTAEGGNAE